jgi:hypothetical protein
MDTRAVLVRETMHGKESSDETGTRNAFEGDMSRFGHF